MPAVQPEARFRRRLAAVAEVVAWAGSAAVGRRRLHLPVRRSDHGIRRGRRSGLRRLGGLVGVARLGHRGRTGEREQGEHEQSQRLHGSDLPEGDDAEALARSGSAPLQVVLGNIGWRTKIVSPSLLGHVRHVQKAPSGLTPAVPNARWACGAGQAARRHAAGGPGASPHTRARSLTLARGAPYCGRSSPWYAAAPARKIVSHSYWARSQPAPCCCSWRARCWRGCTPTRDGSRCGAACTSATARTPCASSAA